MSEWLAQPLGALAAFQKGRKVETSEHPREGFAPYLGASAISGVIEEYGDTRIGVMSAAGDVLMLWDGERSGLVGKAQAGVISSTVARLSPKTDVEGEYLYYALDFKFEWIQGRRTGTGVPHVPKDLARILSISYPKSKHEQRRIAEILSALDEAIEQTEALIAKHQQIKAGLIRDLFTRGVTPDGHLRPSREQAPDLYKESPLGWIPKEWGVVRLSSLAQFITSGSRGWAEYYNEIGPLFLRIGNLTREHINFRWDSIVRVSLPKFTEGQRTAVMPEDILISITADLGIVAVVNKLVGEAYVNQHIALVRLVPCSLSSRFLGHFLTTGVVQNQLVRLNDSGAKAGLNLPAVGKILIVQPRDGSESIQIASMIDACDFNTESHKLELAKLRQQKHGLMCDLLTGKVRVRIHGQGYTI